MNELDKYFEKARNVEPQYDEDDTRKFLAGKLSDGGIATNLYNKIKVYPMLTALITSVATIATIALLSISSPEITTEKASSPKYTSTMPSARHTGSDNLNSNDTEPVKPNEEILAVVTEEMDEAPKVDKTVSEPSQKWTDDSSIDVKAVNSLKLTKDELAQLGIEVDRESFKVNAFDKYRYIIYKNNDKQRDYYNKDEDRDAMPTPAMITTKTGFKTLTLFKKGNVEAIVDRKRTISDGGKSAEQIIAFSKYETDDADIDIKVDRIENENRELSSDSDLNYVVDGDTVSVKYAKKTDSSQRSLEIKFPRGFSDNKDIDKHNARLDKLVNSLDDKQVASVFRKKDPNERKDTLLSSIDLGYVNSEFFDDSFNVVEELLNALKGNPDSTYILENIERIRSIKLAYQYSRLALDFQQKLKSNNHRFDFNEYDFREVFDKELDSSLFGNEKYHKTFKLSWWGYPDFFDKKEKSKIESETIITQINFVNKLVSDKFKDAPKFDMTSQKYDDYKKSLIGNKDSAEILSEFEKIQTLDFTMNGQKISFDFQKLIGNGDYKNSVLNSVELSEFFKLTPSDTNSSKGVKNIELEITHADSEVPIKITSINIKKTDNYDPSTEIGKAVWFDGQLSSKSKNNHYVKDLLLRESDDVNVVMLNSNTKIMEGEVVSLVSERNVNVYSTDLEREDIDKIVQATLDSLPNKNTTLIEVDATEESSSNDPNNKTIYMPMESLGEGKKIKIINGEPSELEGNVYTVPKGKLIIEDGETDLDFILKQGQTIWADENQDGVNKSFRSNMKFEFMNYNINELIPIEISFDGENTDFIVWYEASEDFLTNLPQSILEKINPELAAISEQSQNCDNAPIKKDDAVMDVWSGCSGAIKEMRVFPNPATSNSKVEFNLEDSRQISIAIYDLSGKLIKRTKNGMSLNKGRVTESLNLNGVNPGMYYVVVKSELGEQALQRVIIE